MSCSPHLVLCHCQHLCCLAAEPIRWNNAAAAAAAAGTGLAGSSAAELLSDVEPRPPSSGLVPAFSNSKKLIYCRLLLLPSRELHLICTSSDGFSARGRNKGVFLHSKAARCVFVGGGVSII